MSQIEFQKVIGNNTANKLSPVTVDLTRCGKIIPGKFTFLQSNQLITKYVQQGNVRQNSETKILKNNKKPNSYENCNTEKIIIDQLQQEKQAKIQKILQQAKGNSHRYQKSIEKSQSQAQNQVKKIQMMIQNTYMKAADIMLGRNNSTFTRKLNDQAIPLKQMNQHTCDKSLKKIQATRKVMISKSQAILQNATFDKHLSRQISMLSDSFNNTSNSLLSNSVLSNQKQAKKQTEERQNKLKKLLKTQSFESLYNAQRRQAAAEGFGIYWQIGSQSKKTVKNSLFKQNEEKITKIAKKSKKAEFKPLYFEEICKTDNCQFTRNKKYSNAFAEHTNNYSLTLIQNNNE